MLLTRAPRAVVGITPETGARNRNFLDRFNATQLNWEHVVGFPAGERTKG